MSRHRFATSVACLLALTGCDPSEKERVEQAKKNHIECLEKFCNGDSEPARNMATEVALKLNGSWYVGPKEYFSPSRNGGGFYWPSRHPMFKGGDYPEGRTEFPDKAIEIFLDTPRQPAQGRSLYQTLLDKERRGEILEKTDLHPGLEMWRSREGESLLETWYLSISQKDQNGEPPVIVCRGTDPTRYPCTTGFRWQADVAVSMRFRAMHAPEWPAIYQETTRILNLLRKA